MEPRASHMLNLQTNNLISYLFLVIVKEGKGIREVQKLIFLFFSTGILSLNTELLHSLYTNPTLLGRENVNKISNTGNK